MPHSIPADSIGLVTPQIAHFDTPLQLDCGRSLTDYDLIYESYGTLNRDHSNAIPVSYTHLTLPTIYSV